MWQLEKEAGTAVNLAANEEHGGASGEGAELEVFHATWRTPVSSVGAAGRFASCVSRLTAFALNNFGAVFTSRDI